MMVDLITKSDVLELKQILHEILDRLPNTNTGTAKAFLNAKEVKEILGCSDSTLSNYRNRKMLSATKVGNRFYYSQEGLCNLLSKKEGGNFGN